ncbi:DUF4998 domain-containing protein [Sphingobacterium bambusae]|uniref:DUF4998 domain-containing protein n=1 Tax=Sphingobacterium bambusae TaxID=662858 RepID=A0ABW6BET3_9SPHI|nr:DUF4998 domain-containing protein [Sphingobacterium bambusae]WPL49552.1 DUF4998 domain-containing protein [Sphingobacterium bambusae]
MKKRYNNFKRSYVILSFLLLLGACAKIDDYKQFVENGDISYTGKIDSVVVFSGDERVLVQGLFRSDPKVTMCRIYWNNMRDSMDVPVVKTGGIDTMRQLISLPENLYNFRIHTFDALGNRSVPVYATGQSYGDAYKASLNNRLIISAIADQNDNVTIVWRDIDKTLGAVSTQVEYTDKSNSIKRINTPVGESRSVLPNYKPETTFSYRTLYIPDTLSIDTFGTPLQAHAYSYKIDKSDWLATADTYEATGQLPNGGPPHFVIDDNPNTYWHTRHSAGTTPFPHWLAFDMKKPVKVDMVELTSRHDYLGADFKDFLIEGRNAETEEWVPYGSFNLADVAGPQQFLIASAPTLRYIRIYQLNGGGPPHSHLAEFSVYGTSTP